MRLRIILVGLSLFAFLSVSVAGYLYYSSLYLRDFRDVSRRISGPLAEATGSIILAICMLIGVAVFIFYRAASDDIVLWHTPAVVTVKDCEGRYTFVNSRTRTDDAR